MNRRLTGFAVSAVTALAVACNPAHGVNPEPTPPVASASAAPSATPVINPYDADYGPGFRLKALSADAIAAVDKPAPARDGGRTVDPAYGTRIYRATTADDGQGGRVRHDYSRRQAFNADNTRFIAMDGAGYWHLYDATNYAHLGVLEGFAGDCEPIWHATDPAKLYFTGVNGSTQWQVMDVNTMRAKVAFDFAGQSPWPDAKSFWTKAEGTTSADGRYLSLVATAYDEASQENTIYGLVTVDLVEEKIVGTLDASQFPTPGAMPDHISTSASGRYAVVSWAHDDGGTRAYTLDFASSKQLTPNTEHSDLAFGPDKQDYFVYTDYASGKIVAVDLDTEERIDLHTLYPVPGAGYAAHISGKAFDRPGWVVVSTYGDFENYNVSPATELQPEYRKVWLQELKPGGRALNVTHTQAKAAAVDKAYFEESQATPSRDLSRIMFASNFGGDAIESYVVGLPTTFEQD